MCHGRQKLYRGISAIIGSAIIIAIFIVLATSTIIMMDRLNSLIMEVTNSVIGRSDRLLILYGVESWWSFNGSNIVIYIDNKMSKAALLTAIVIVYSDESYETISRINRTIDRGIVMYHNEWLSTSMHKNLQLPYPLPPATTTIINLQSTKTPIAISIAVMTTSNNVAIPSKKS